MGSQPFRCPAPRTTNQRASKSSGSSDHIVRPLRLYTPVILDAQFLLVTTRSNKNGVRLASVLVLLAGLLISLYSCGQSDLASEWEAGLFFILAGGITLLSTFRSDSFTSIDPPIPRQKEPPEVRKVSTDVPTLHQAAPPDTRCVDCEATLSGDAFYLCAGDQKRFICTKCRDLRILARRAANTPASTPPPNGPQPF